MRNALKLQNLDKHRVQHPPPLRHRRHLRLVRIDLIPVQFAAADVHIDIPHVQPALSLPSVAAGPEEENDGERKVRLEKALYVVEAAAWRANGDKEL